jgi:hypothetical protein
MSSNGNAPGYLFKASKKHGVSVLSAKRITTLYRIPLWFSAGRLIAFDAIFCRSRSHPLKGTICSALASVVGTRRTFSAQ